MIYAGYELKIIEYSIHLWNIKNWPSYWPCVDIKQYSIIYNNFIKNEIKVCFLIINFFIFNCTCQLSEKAKELRMDAFSSSLLYSKMQNHKVIKETAEKAAKKYNIPFYYYDFREGWQNGIDISKELEIYRQNYCGCIYSEEDRFLSQLSKKYAKKYEEINEYYESIK